MAHNSPAVSLVWVILNVTLSVFLVFHLWSFDRFKCLRWNRGPHSAAFRRIMAYTFLASVPLFTSYSLGIMVIKYQYGYSYVLGYGILPTPYELWSEHARGAILPLYICFSLAWAFALVTHLEELCFWLFLINSGSSVQDWFRTLYFKAWAFGSCIAIIYMPLVTILTRSDLLKCEAYTFLAGGLGSLSLTLWFLPILYAFPSFIESLKQSNMEKNTLIRLTKYHELNCIRIFFRFLCSIPFVILGVDGVRPHQHINDKMLPTDLLAIVASVGFVISSGITLMIFFPRSIESEMAQKDAVRERRRGMPSRPSHFTLGTRHLATSNDVMFIQPAVSVPAHASTGHVHMHGYPNHGYSLSGDVGSLCALPSYDRIPIRDGDIITGGEHGDYYRPQHRHNRSRQQQREPRERYREAAEGEGDSEGEGGSRFSGDSGPMMMMQPNRRTNDGDVELGGVVTLSRGKLTRYNRTARRGAHLSHMMHNWRSPIDLAAFSSS